MKSRTLTKTVKERITQDWLNVFKDFGHFRPMRLGRLSGPILVGICLDRTRSNDVYLPSAHIHPLVEKQPAVLLTLRHSLPDDRYPRLAREIRVDQHETLYRSAAEALKLTAPFVNRLNWTLRDVLLLYNEYLVSKVDPAISRDPRALFRNVILLSAWGGHDEYARSCLEAAERAMAPWPADGTSPGEWRGSLERQLDSERLEATVQSEIAAHHLEGLPEHGFDPNGPVEPTIVDVYRELSK